MVLLIIAGAGALKQVLEDRGVSDYIAGLLKGSADSSLLLARGITAIVRVCVGSATVAGLTAAGIVLPVIGETGVSPELMSLS
jgi:Gnt-I system high-affinity gluconate transporter